jgi:hypothetical protein
MSITQRAILGFTTLGMVGLLASSCGNSSTTISGQLDTAQFRLVDAQIIAIDAHGSTRRASIGADGAFSIELPVPATYNIRFANGTSQAGIYDAFAVLTDQNTAGQIARRFTIKEGGTIDLGIVRRPAGSKSFGLRAASDDDDDDDADSSDDGDSDGSDDDGDSDSSGGGVHEDDVELVCDLGRGGDISEVEAENDMSGYADADADGVTDDQDDDSSCDHDDDADSDDDSDGTGTATVADDDSDGDSDSDSDGHGCRDAFEDTLDEPCGGNSGAGETGDPVPDPNGTQTVPGNL